MSARYFGQELPRRTAADVRVSLVQRAGRNRAAWGETRLHNSPDEIAPAAVPATEADLPLIAAVLHLARTAMEQEFPQFTPVCEEIEPDSFAFSTPIGEDRFPHGAGFAVGFTLVAQTRPKDSAAPKAWVVIDRRYRRRDDALKGPLTPAEAAMHLLWALGREGAMFDPDWNSAAPLDGTGWETKFPFLEINYGAMGSSCPVECLKGLRAANGAFADLLNAKAIEVMSRPPQAAPPSPRIGELDGSNAPDFDPF